MARVVSSLYTAPLTGSVNLARTETMASPRMVFPLLHQTSASLCLFMDADLEDSQDESNAMLACSLLLGTNPFDRMKTPRRICPSAASLFYRFRQRTHRIRLRAQLTVLMLI